MRLICYPVAGEPPLMRPAPQERRWMDQTSDGFAYRCLPLNIANCHGWQIINPTSFAAQWNGGLLVEDLTVTSLAAGVSPLATAHFGTGILTFSVDALFRTEPGYDLYVTGPVNEFKDGIQPLAGIVETDWSVGTFTMNWRFTRKNSPVVFAEGEPFCTIFPVQRGLIESVEPEIRPIGDDPALHEAYVAWASGRRNFNRELKEPGSEAYKARWQKDYFRGESPLGVAPDDHRTKLRLKPFKTIGDDD